MIDYAIEDSSDRGRGFWQSPPHVRRKDWRLDPSYTFLNHGSYGAAPRTVLAAQDEWRERMEARPTTFMVEELPQALRDAAGKLAVFLGAESDDLVFVENATAGCNVVFNAVGLTANDEILVTDHGYPAIRKAAQYAAHRSGARVTEAEVQFPLRDPAEIVEAVGSRLGPRTRLVVLDHVTSPTAAIFPVRELVGLCHAAGAQVLVDGAHAPGMLPIDVPSIGADYYVGNCHKWLMGPKGSAFLWAARSRQQDLHPLVISHGYGKGFLAEFDWIGTRDFSAWLAVPAAIAFLQRLGAQRLMDHNIQLARDAVSLLAREWRTERGTPDALTGSMASVRLPIDQIATDQQARAMQIWLLSRHRIEVAVNAIAGGLWARISAQAYNGIEDYQRLAEVFRQD